MIRPNPKLTVQLGSWPQLKAHTMPIRLAVFVDEQKVPLELEWDELDEHCTHAAAWLDGSIPVGTARLDPDGHIGRMAVLATHRQQGIGSALLKSLIDHAHSRTLKYLELNAQTHAIPFYQRFGFSAIGETFDDAGIPHRRMFLNL